MTNSAHIFCLFLPVDFSVHCVYNVKYFFFIFFYNSIFDLQLHVQLFDFHAVLCSFYAVGS